MVQAPSTLHASAHICRKILLSFLFTDEETEAHTDFTVDQYRDGNLASDTHPHKKEQHKVTETKKVKRHETTKYRVRGNIIRDQEKRSIKSVYIDSALIQ